MKTFPLFHEKGKTSIANFSNVANTTEVIINVMKATTRKRKT